MACNKVLAVVFASISLMAFAAPPSILPSPTSCRTNSQVNASTGRIQACPTTTCQPEGQAELPTVTCAFRTYDAGSGTTYTYCACAEDVGDPSLSTICFAYEGRNEQPDGSYTYFPACTSDAYACTTQQLPYCDPELQASVKKCFCQASHTQWNQ